MDSLTQITLGAACGELVAGKKVGNRAMLWGAIGGTIPDLDVLANFFMDHMAALAFHRAITHSLFFAVVAPPILGWLVYRFYRSGIYKKIAYKWFITLFWLAFLLLLFNGIPYLFTGKLGLNLLLITGAVALGVFALLFRGYISQKSTEVDLSWKGWALVFFWSILTHPLLDCCTQFGTQLFQPFSNFRVAWDNISVVDPIYTFPFLFCLLIAGVLSREKKWRRWVTIVGIVMSCSYIALTFYFKYKVNKVFTDYLQEQQIEYDRYVTTPTIFNSILWQGVAEGDSVFYHGFYSLLDDKPVIMPLNEFPKNHHLLHGHENDEDVRILEWFCQGYFNVLSLGKDSLQINNLKYGLTTDNYQLPTDYTYRFLLKKGRDSTYHAHHSRAGTDFSGERFQEFLDRIKGK